MVWIYKIIIIPVDVSDEFPRLFKLISSSYMLYLHHLVLSFYEYEDYDYPNDSFEINHCQYSLGYTN